MFSVLRTYDGLMRDLETSVVVTNVRHAVKMRLYDSENRVCDYALTNSLGRGVDVAISYDGSYATNMAYALPNGSRFAASLTRKASRKQLVARRDYSFDNQPTYWYSTDYDLVGRPTNATDSVSLVREWLYNRRSELAAAQMGTNLYGYAYDTIGNRLWSAYNVTTNTYAANNLNQYSSIVCGSASPCEPAYDTDGNLTGDYAFSYSFDAENRLLSATSTEETNGAICVINAYDHRHRRLSKTVQRLSVSCSPPPSPPVETREWNTVETRTFVWDGNNIVLEKVALADGMVRTFEYFWGMDKSGTEQGAGGVEGLLAVSMDGVFYIPCYDHNGNIVRYVSETGDIAAQYVYDPYGNVVESCGSLADAFSFGFSTKYNDRETGMVVYQRRFYSPDLGRWLNRDPIDEDGGVNLYCICDNNLVMYFDELGMVKVTVISGAATSPWERFQTGNQYKDVVVESVSDIGIVETQLGTKNGVFRYPYANNLEIGDCEIRIYVEIQVSNLLSSDTKRDDIIHVKNHDVDSPRGQSTGYSIGTSGKRPPRGAIIAHEQGHALAYLAALSRFISALERFGNKKLTEADKAEARKIYAQYLKEFNQINMRSANETEKAWYEANGYKIEPTPGGYNAMPK